MTLAADASGPAAAETSSDHQSASLSPEEALVHWLAHAFHRPVTQAALRARLPAGASLGSAQGLARGLSAVGLRSHLVQRSPGRIDPVALPAVVFSRDGQPLVLKEMSGKAKTAVLLDPANGNLTEEVPLRALKRRLKPEVLLVTPSEDQTGSRLSPETRRETETRSHWFWGAVRANWRSWAQVILAAFIVNVLTLALPLFVMNVYDKVIPNLAFVSLWTLAIGVGIALVLDLVVRTIRVNILETVSRRIDIKVASRLFDQAMRIKLLARPGGPAGLATTIRDFETVREFFASATFIAAIDLAFIGIFIAVLYMIVGPLALVPTLAVPVVLLLSLFAQFPIARSAAQAQRMATKRQVVLVEALSGIETIKSLNAEPVMQREWETAIAASSQINGRTKFWSNVATNGAQAVQQAVSIGIIVWGVFLVADGLITIGGLIAANILAGRVLAPLGTLAQTTFRAQYAAKSLAALNRFMALPVNRGDVVASDLQVKRGAIKMEAVSLTYPGAATPALKEFNFAIEPGACVAFLGKVGSGKTTAGKVMAGLLPADSGIVQIDGIEIAQYDPADLREGIGYLPQTPELFTGTLKENLLVAAPGATDEALMQALYFAAMDDFVADAQMGLELFVGEQGNRLSGGQKQGIALARLLLREPKMLFLDEPTNAMDQRMEAQVVERLKTLNAGGTGLILCTHRQTLTEMADRLVVVDKGRVVLDGPRTEVISKLQHLSARSGS